MSRPPSMEDIAPIVRRFPGREAQIEALRKAMGKVGSRVLRHRAAAAAAAPSPCAAHALLRVVRPRRRSRMRRSRRLA